MCSGLGDRDTHAKILKDGRPIPHTSAGTPYTGIAWPEIIELVENPPSVPKTEARWFIASTYKSHDARGHDAQRERGEFHALVLDEDGRGNNLSLDEIAAAVAAAVGGVSRIIYSSQSATASRRKWRVILPLDVPIKGVDLRDTQDAFFDLLEDTTQGVLIPDRALARANQIAFLPNRGEHYEHRFTPGPPHRGGPRPRPGARQPDRGHGPAERRARHGVNGGGKTSHRAAQ